MYVVAGVQILDLESARACRHNSALHNYCTSRLHDDVVYFLPNYLIKVAATEK